MTKELSTHRRCRCQERLFLCFSPMLIFQEDDTLFNFFLNWTVMVFEVPPHLQCEAWQTQMKIDNEFQIFCFVALVFDVETWLLFLHNKGCFYHSPEILQGLHKKCRILLLYRIKTMKLLPAENQFLHSSYYRPLICTRRSVFCLDL